MMTHKIFILSLFCATLLSCVGIGKNSERCENVEPAHINRFDKELYAFVDTNDSLIISSLNNRYAEMLDLFGKGVLNQYGGDDSDLFRKLHAYFSEPTLKALYADAIALYDNVDSLEMSLGSAFAFLKDNFPSMQTPALYMHVSGFNQNLLVSDSLLSISIDKYLGSDYPLYNDFFYDSQKVRMTPDFIVPDYIAAWIMSEYPFAGNDKVLLDRMIYAGKLKYVVQQASGIDNIYMLLGYNDRDIKWCRDNEGGLWKAIIERKHLYTPDAITTSTYFEDAGRIFTGSDVPWSIGTWIGWRIVSRYMKHSGASIEQLMGENDAQKILSASKYKPF